MLLAQSMRAMFPGVCAARREGSARARVCVCTHTHTHTGIIQTYLFQVACKDFSAQYGLIGILQSRNLPESAPEIRILDGKVPLIYPHSSEYHKFQSCKNGATDIIPIGNTDVEPPLEKN
jgi:hypothetical protein